MKQAEFIYLLVPYHNDMERINADETNRPFERPGRHCDRYDYRTSWPSTQWASYKLGFQMGLGDPWFLLSGTSIYYPWRLFEWWYAYEAYAPEIFRKAGAMEAGGGILGTTTAVVGSLWRARQTKHVTTYGSAEWATEKDIANSELLNDRGVFLGKTKSAYLRHDGPEHVLAFAPTRSGKSVGLVVPTLLTWTGSAVIHDITGSLHKGRSWI